MKSKERQEFNDEGEYFLISKPLTLERGKIIEGSLCGARFARRYFFKNISRHRSTENLKFLTLIFTVISGAERQSGDLFFFNAIMK